MKTFVELCCVFTGPATGSKKLCTRKVWNCRKVGSLSTAFCVTRSKCLSNCALCSQVLPQEVKSSVQEKSGTEGCAGSLSTVSCVTGSKCLTVLRVHRSRYKKYKALYKKSLEQGDQESQRGKLWELEETLDVTNILIARQQARLEVSSDFEK